ncbi:signal peptide-containing protein [Theileria equi strain WA]|uniref:Signal peptide-containing protein n=1 Tax=Theileria equi strain WA TaxID=1537102 RepID=L0B0J6_THEEQ|nr:signal peptide-containing protein [Theileria equi strain WA]AFZ80659.1 signal peptide-containing protein [Theileria equi strain WA]|eukprot:XP_004830325.1 signal peptide-containing protein [Theileria equi strain WA]
MRLIILVHILATIKLCSAGWPRCLRCCLKGSEDDGVQDAYTRGEQGASGSSVPLEELHEEIHSFLSGEGDVPQPTRPQPITRALDLSKPDKTVTSLEIHRKAGVKYKNYYEKVDCQITSVVDGNQELWAISDQEQYLLAEIYERGRSTLLRIDVINPDEYKPKLFEKVDGKWNAIGILEFFRKLDVMRKSGQASGSISSRSSYFSSIFPGSSTE